LLDFVNITNIYLAFLRASISKRLEPALIGHKRSCLHFLISFLFPTLFLRSIGVPKPIVVRNERETISLAHWVVIRVGVHMVFEAKYRRTLSYQSARPMRITGQCQVR